jgi:hypothetical protein
MNWLERARREIGGSIQQPTANSAERNPTAATAVLYPTPSEEVAASIGSNGSALLMLTHESEALREAYEERAAIIEFDGGFSHDEAERAAWALVAIRRRLH